MIVRALDADGDWTFGKGKNDYKTGLAAISQSVETRLKSFLGDCFFALSAGIDWFNLLGSKNKLALQLAVSATILNTREITSIISLTLNYDPFTRNLLMNYIIQSVNGTIEAKNAAVPNFILTQEGDVLLTEGGEPIVV